MVIKKLAFSYLFSKPRDVSTSSSSCSSTWPWPTCKQPRTHSFRAGPGEDSVFKTVNSIYFDSAESGLTFTSEDLFSESFSTASSLEDYSTETVIRGLRSDRLFFDGGDQSSSILDEAAKPFKGSFALAMESEDPYRDFRASMEEMVVANGIRNWQFLEELLVWYLRVNGKKTHGYILGAFVDLLLGLASSSSSSSSFDHNCSSSTSSSYTSASSSFEIEEEIIEEDEQNSRIN